MQDEFAREIPSLSDQKTPIGAKRKQFPAARMGFSLALRGSSECSGRRF